MLRFTPFFLVSDNEFIFISVEFNYNISYRKIVPRLTILEVLPLNHNYMGFSDLVQPSSAWNH
jgi:hypothetical protein